MMLTRRALLARLGVAGTASLLVACSAVASPGQPAASNPAPAAVPPAQSAGSGSFAVLGAPSEPAGLNPLLLDNGSSGPAWELLFEGLIAPDPQSGAASAALAQTWDASADGLTWTFHLRPNVMWSDGQPF